MAINGANNVSITLQLTLTSSATTLILPTGKGGLLSGATPPLRGVIEEYDDTKNVVKREIVSITAISGDQLTITRAVEACPIADSASAQQQVSQVFATPAKTKISIAMTKGMIDDINTSIAGLTSSKLNKVGETRTGLTPNRVIATNGAGEEIAVGGSAGQVLGFGAGGAPEAVSPTVDIGGLPSKTTPVGADQLLLSDSEAGGVNKKISLKDAVIIADQIAQSAFTGDTDLFVVKQASGGLRKMTVADIRRALINSSFNYTQAKVSVIPSAGTANVFDYSASYATGSNGGGMITALFKHTTNGGSYVTGIVQISDDNSNWTTIWSEQWYENDSYPDYRAISLIFKAGYVRIGVARDFGYSGGVRIKGSATINLTK